jgi:predicted DNA-binding protein YlxM (UPF0122 family)
MSITAATIRKEQRSVKVATLFAQGLSQAKIAEKLGVARTTIENDIKRIGPVLDNGGETLQALRASLKKKIKPEFRVEAIRKTIEKVDSNPFAALKGVAMANYLDGVDQVLAPKHEEQTPAEHRPIFNIAGGAKITLTLADCKRPAPPQDVVVEATTVQQDDENKG